MSTRAIEQLEEQADQLRARGLLEAAAALYEELLTIEPDNLKSERLLSSITGRDSMLPSSPGGLKAAPFMVTRNFLSAEMHDALLESLLSKAGEFKPALTTEGLLIDYRNSMTLPLFQVDRALAEAFHERLLAHWPHARTRLRVPEFEPSLSETHALLYFDGGLFATHRDTAGPNNTRRVTFVYNLHRKPRHFRGGDLLLYDTYFRPCEPQFATTYTRLIPEDNRLVWFPSEFYHEVTPVSHVGGAVSGARIAINGWLNTTREDGDPDRISLTPY